MKILMTLAMLSTDDRGIDDMLAMLSTADEGIDDMLQCYLLMMRVLMTCYNAIYWWWGYWWHATMLSTDDEGIDDIIAVLSIDDMVLAML